MLFYQPMMKIVSKTKTSLIFIFTTLENACNFFWNIKTTHKIKGSLQLAQLFVLHKK